MKSRYTFTGLFTISFVVWSIQTQGNESSPKIASSEPTSSYFNFMAEENEKLTNLWNKVRSEENFCKDFESKLQCFTHEAQKFDPKSSAFFSIYLAILTSLSGAGTEHFSDENRIEATEQAIFMFETIRLKNMYSYSLEVKDTTEVEVKLLQKEDRESLYETLKALKRVSVKNIEILEKSLERAPASVKSKKIKEIIKLKQRIESLSVR